jgi:hypothetical protein
VADIVFAFDPALDRPIPVPEAAPATVAEAITAAPLEALRAAVATAHESKAAVFVLCGRILDPLRASPAQAATLRSMILDLAAEGCRTVWMADDATASAEAARMLGEPKGLAFVTPLEPLHLEVRGLGVELFVARGTFATAAALAAPTVAVSMEAAFVPLRRRLVVGWDSGHWNAERWDAVLPEAARADATATGADREAEAVRRLPGWSQPDTLCVWGSRRVQHLPAGVRHLPSLQPRSAHESQAGGCATLALVDRAEPADTPAATGRSAAAAVAPIPHADWSHADWRHSWHEVPTQRVAWQTITVASPAGGDEELATTIWSALENLPAAPQSAVEIVRCSVECGTSVPRRVRVAEISAETLARVRQLFDGRTVRGWCHELSADSSESLAPLGRGRSGGRPGSTTSFSTALADIVMQIEQQPAQPKPASMARESAWLALELIESI